MKHKFKISGILLFLSGFINGYLSAQISKSSLSSENNNPKLYFGISLDPGFSKLNPTDQITFYQPNTRPHNSLWCQLSGGCGMHLGALKPALDIGLDAGIYLTKKIHLSTGIYYSHIGGRFLVDGLLFAENADSDIQPNYIIDSAYAFSNPLYDINDITYTGNYFMVPIILHFDVPGEVFKANLAIGTRQYFLSNGSAAGDVTQVTILHNSYGYGSTTSIGNQEIDITNEMQKFYLALEIGVQLTWSLNNHFLFLIHPEYVYGLSYVMEGDSEIFIGQYASTSNFDSGGDMYALPQDFRLRKFGLGIGLQYTL